MIHKESTTTTNTLQFQHVRSKSVILFLSVSPCIKDALESVTVELNFALVFMPTRPVYDNFKHTSSLTPLSYKTALFRYEVHE